MTIKTWLIGVLSFIALGAGVVVASECIQDGKNGLRDCKAGCKDTFLTTKDICNNRDPNCMTVCRADRAGCRADTGIDEDFAKCLADLVAAKGVCRDPNNGLSGTALDHCIDQAQIVAFQCRDAAREKWRSALLICRKKFRVCARACPPADPNLDPNDPNVVPPAVCKVNAKTDFKTCNGNCREDFQVIKDACLNRDHACVEVCRSQRDTCADPILTNLADEIAQINMDRKADITTCNNLYPNNPTDLDLCIDDAQVSAFEKRDQAQEDANKLLQPCRDTFMSCAQGCPPASP
jgi:hypothetical protein